MKKSWSCLLALSTAVAFAGNDWKQNVDLGTYDIGDYTGLVFFGSDSTVTLSKDATLANPQVNTSGGAVKILFDFKSGGDHALAITGSAGFFVGCSDADVLFKGGTWDCGFLPFYAGAQYNNMHGHHIVIDGVNVKCGTFVTSENAYDSFIALSNGTTVTASALNAFQPKKGTGSVPTSNITFVVASGSKVEVSGNVCIDYGYGTAFNDYPLDYRMRVTGTGSSLTGKTLELGTRWRGTELRFADHATGCFSDRLYMGEKATATENALVVESGATLTLNSTSKVGQSVGADGNRVQVLDGATLVLGPNDPYEALVIGSVSSHNELLVSNATLSCRYAQTGENAGASNNVVRFVGPEASYLPQESMPVFFGKGWGNRYVFENCQMDFGTKQFTFGTASTNNTVELADEAVLSAATVWLGYVYGGGLPAYDNAFVVGEGSVLTANVSLTSLNNRLVVSNGTFVARSEYGFCLGDSSSGNTLEISNNWLVVQGASSLLTTADSYGRVLLHRNSGLRFEVPPEGYGTAPLDLQIDSDGTMKLEVVGVEGVQRYLSDVANRSSVEIPLTSKYAGNVPDAQIESVNAAMPKNCYVYKNAKSPQNLILHVRQAPHGLAVVFR